MVQQCCCLLLLHDVIPSAVDNELCFAFDAVEVEVVEHFRSATDSNSFFWNIKTQLVCQIFSPPGIDAKVFLCKNKI